MIADSRLFPHRHNTDIDLGWTRVSTFSPDVSELRTSAGHIMWHQWLHSYNQEIEPWYSVLPQRYTPPSNNELNPAVVTDQKNEHLNTSHFDKNHLTQQTETIIHMLSIYIFFLLFPIMHAVYRLSGELTGG